MKQNKLSMEQLATKTLKELDSLYLDMDKIALYISTNPNVRSIFQKADVNNLSNREIENHIISLLTSITVPNDSSRFRINLYNEKGNYISTGLVYDQKTVTNFLNQPNYNTWYRSLPIVHNNKSITGFKKDVWSNEDVLYSSLYRELFNSNFVYKTTGIIQVQCPYDYINELLTFEKGSYSCYLYDNHGNLIYPNNKNDFSKDLYNQSKTQKKQKSGTVDQFIYAKDQSGFSNFTLIITQPIKEISSVIFKMMTILVLLGIVVLCISLFLIFYISKQTTQPLRELTSSIHNVNISNLFLEVSDLSPSELGKIDEFTQLNLAFNKMFDRLKDSMDEVIKTKAHEMKAHMNALQSQMDPHFLFNMLTIIKAMSQENQTIKIGQVCDYLSYMFRYMASYDEDYVSIETEFDHGENYLKLMKIRYEDQFTYHFEINPQINYSNIKLPKLSIQPILENCFLHGFKKVLPPWNITIHCWVNEPRWYLTITDNGTGFSKEDIEKLNDKVKLFLENPGDNLSLLKIGGMGLVNTIARLKLKYRDQVTLHIEPLLQGGTCVSIGGICEDEYFIS